VYLEEEGEEEEGEEEEEEEEGEEKEEETLVGLLESKRLTVGYRIFHIHDKRTVFP
jgi:hypothetical protein